MPRSQSTPVRRSLLLIADIGGYTDYMRTHRLSLAHAEVNMARLLDRVVDAAPGFDLVEIEGDAAFMSRPAAGMTEADLVRATLEVAAAMHQAFHVERRYVGSNLCPCRGCTEVDRLRLKFVAHVGEVATQTIRQRQKLVGIDVIQVHRMLKNAVEIPEYVLLSDDLHRLAGATSPPLGTPIDQDLEGIGPTRAFAVDVSDLPATAALPSPDPTLRSRLRRTLAVAGAGTPYLVGLRRPRGAAR
ncbi:DUF2652 domain-containing protein [Nocardioides sp. zg-579]|uniref:DUF2652 domain-containing protein n=1 Tax=Nocardioides marmotae TaxID=2663857 RepID=A0A6I3JCA6_9ACTN|nr:DUF2652 domain-containing protein [Nocardioides marmotae]MCR6032146.1 DUF2652 domain-containing protein [Gordonia jinghuaiqii]MTB95792.1 DUF2652 domain-containing protein [Nocardioides marmotae]QKE02850.1 DUF2652 domain-containing protein [Nocardioides marmotae]